MRKVRVDYKVYFIDELSEEAKEKAYHNWLNDFDYPWGDDNVKTLEEFEKIFPIKIYSWEYGYRKYIDFDMTCDDDIAELSGVRLLKYIHNNYYEYLFERETYHKNNKKRVSKIFYKTIDCPLTGYCMDDEILEPIYKFLKNPSEYITFEELVAECLDNWINACDADYEYCTSIEYFIEESKCNDWEYFEDGTIANFRKDKIIEAC